MRATSKETVVTARVLRRRMSPPEVVLWQVLRTRPGGLKFRRQRPAGRYVADFYCPAGKLVIEVDGEAHDFESRAEMDAERDAALLSAGLQVMRIAAGEIHKDLNAVLIAILAAARK